MSVENNKKLVGQFLRFFETGEIDENILTPGFTSWTAMSGEVAREPFLATGRGLPNAFRKPLKIIPTGMVAEGDKIAVEGAADAEMKDGTPYRNRYHFLFEFENGKIARLREYMDTKAALEILVPALGLKM